MKKNVRKQTGLIFLLPNLAGVLIFYLIPFADVILRSFSGAATKKWVGLSNYMDVIGNQAFQLAAGNTGKFLVFCIPLLIVMSLLIAVIMDRSFENVHFFKTLFLIPMAIPVASVALIWRILFHGNGLVNHVLILFYKKIPWMDSDAAFVVLIICYIWRNIGYNIVLWMAGLSSIPKSLYEAATVDGAGEWTSFLHITLPSLLPSFFTITVLSFLNSFKVFRESYLVAGDYPHKSIYMLQHLFNNWFRDFSLDKMAAGAVMTALFIFIPILFLQRRWEHEHV